MKEIDAFNFSSLKSDTILRKNVNDDDDDDDESNYFIKECDAFESEIKALKMNKDSNLKTVETEKKRKEQEEKLKKEGEIIKAKKRQLDELKAINKTILRQQMENDELEAVINTRTQTNSSKFTQMQTIEIEKQKKELEEVLKREEEKKEAKQKMLDKLKSLSTTVQQVKEEVNKLDQQYEEKLFEDQTTREVSKTELYKAEARLLELDIKQKKIANIFADLKKAEKVDICFMLDCTGSMGPYINEAKSVIHKIIDNLKIKFQNFELRVAFVGYRDHGDGAGRITSFSFSSNIDDFKTFVSLVDAAGGADAPEDVFGGLEVLLF